MKTLIAGKHTRNSEEEPNPSPLGGKVSAIDYIGTFSKDDITSETSRLQEDIANYVPQEWPCLYNSEIGEAKCDMECVSYSIDVALCPEGELFKTERKLQKIQMRAFRRLAFMNPEIAEVNSLLDGESLVYTHR